MGEHLNETINRISTPPADGAAFDEWLEATDGIDLLKENIHSEEFVFYATPGGTFIHSILVPAANVNPPDVEDLMRWSFNAYGTWGVSYTLTDSPRIWLDAPFTNSGTKSFEGGSRLIFPRDFEGRLGNKHYWEILQPFAHVFGLHFLEERNAYCRLDENGDIADLVRIVTVRGRSGEFGGTIITFRRELLDEWMLLTESVIIRTFEFIKRRRDFFDWSKATRSDRTNDGDVFYDFGVVRGQGSFRRGCQIVRPSMQWEDLQRRYGWPQEDKREYASFVAHDWKNGVVREISCAPGATANYFTKSDLPFETSPAFFRPEVLQKYKADSDKYRLEDRSIDCRGAWHLKPLTQKVIQVLARRTARRANVKPGIHILRHSFCSHLAMRGAPARAIQELAGHQDLGTTQRYMHLSPAALDAAIRLLETGTETSRVAVEK